MAEFPKVRNKLTLGKCVHYEAHSHKRLPALVDLCNTLKSCIEQVMCGKDFVPAGLDVSPQACMRKVETHRRNICHLIDMQTDQLLHTLSGHF